MVPVVGKALEAGVLVLLVALLATTMFGSVVPEYRTAAGAELADRTLAGAAERVEQAVPDDVPHELDREVRADLPATIRGRGYEIRATGRELVLDHPTAGVGGRVDLALPPGVRATGSWTSGDDAVVRVRTGEAALRVTLATEPPSGTGGGA
ncbi:MAG: hypothetical protein ABEH47_06070 [Haloferacaceae archaeon]